MRSIALAAGMLAIAGSAAAGGDKPHGHPHFNDGGTLRWYTNLADAQAAAKKANKIVFIEYGREL